MPIYEYHCEDCNQKFEALVLKKGDKIACPTCGGQRYRFEFSVFRFGADSGREKTFSSRLGGGCGCGAGACACSCG
jgi:putative FmdB family regulatory protein